MPCKGGKMSEEQRRQIAEALRGHAVPVSVREKISRKLKGRRVPLERRLRIAKSSCGRKHTVEARRRMSRANKIWVGRCFRLYPEFKNFKALYDRVKRGTTTSFWNWSEDGFLVFLKEAGSIPSTMKKPTIGRIDHSKGYAPGNIEWQENSENLRDGALRRHRGGVMFGEHFTTVGRQ